LKKKEIQGKKKKNPGTQTKKGNPPTKVKFPKKK
jgi:hypothetical protein